jgi:hypothetical protein
MPPGLWLAQTLSRQHQGRQGSRPGPEPAFENGRDDGGAEHGIAMQDAGIAVLPAAVQEAPALPQRTECAPLLTLYYTATRLATLSRMAVHGSSLAWYL